MKSLPNLTGLRFFLASLVVLYHLPQFCENRGFPYFNELAIFSKGSEAVYVFFTLSGFLIIRNLIKEKLATNTINLKNFYRNRVLRIFPLYYLTLTIGFIYYNFIIQLFGYTSEYTIDIGKDLLLGVTFFANILATYKPGGIIEVLWSIAIEEQFYLLIAPLFLFIQRRFIFSFLLVFTLGYFLLYNLSIVEFISKYNMLYYYFSAGGILAFISIKYKEFKLPNLTHYCFLGLFIALFLSNYFKENLSVFQYQLVCTIVFSSSVYFLSLKPYKILQSGVLKFLGKISYGIYVYHAIVFQLIGFIFLKWQPTNSNVFIILFYSSVFLLTIGISALSYKYFEKPFLRLKIK